MEGTGSKCLTKSEAWFPVQIKNDDIERVGKLVWKKHRKCRYVEDADCHKTGKPKRIYNAQEDEDDPNAGNGEDDDATSYDDYDYYEDDDESVSNTDSDDSETPSLTTKEITTTSTKTTSEPTTASTLLPITLIHQLTGHTREEPLTDDTTEPTEIFIQNPGIEGGKCINRQHTYRDKKFEITSVSPNTMEYSVETSTGEFKTGNLSDEQSWKTTKNESTTVILKYYTDDYYADFTNEQTDDRTTSTMAHTDSSTGKSPIDVFGTESSEIHEQNTILKSSSNTLSNSMTVSQKDWSKTYSEIVSERSEMQPSSKYSYTYTDGGSLPNQGKTIYSVYTLSTGENRTVSRIDNFTKDRVDSVTKSVNPLDIQASGEYNTESGINNVTRDRDGSATKSFYTDTPTINENKLNNFTEGRDGSVANATEREGDSCTEDVTDKTNTKRSEMCDQAVTIGKLCHIETPPYPKLPVDLRFPTCCGDEDPLDILSITNTMVTKDLCETEKPGEKKKQKRKKNKKHCRRKSTYLTTEVRPLNTPSTLPTSFVNSYSKGPTQRYIAKKPSGNKNDAKVVVRIPPSLAELPVIVVRDPLTQKLSLSLIDGEQESIHTKPVYYTPPVYHQIFPPFSYNNFYSANIPPFNKMYPFEYMYNPNVRYQYEKANYFYPKRRKFYNNYRWVRDTYEDENEDDEEDRNSTNSKWKIYLTV